MFVESEPPASEAPPGKRLPILGRALLNQNGRLRHLLWSVPGTAVAMYVPRGSPMKLRIACVLVCAGLIAYSATSLLAQPEVMLACCSGTECGSGKCCDYSDLGQLPCSSELPNWCMSACIAGAAR